MQFAARDATVPKQGAKIISLQVANKSAMLM